MEILLSILAVCSRLVPHIPNFTAVGASGIFLGNKVSTKKAIFIILGSMIITDAFIGFNYATPFVYIGMIGYVLIGKTISKNKLTWIGAPLAGSTLFFLITNFGVWLGPWYTHNLGGLIKCYTMAIPFFGRTILSDLLFVSMIYVIYFSYKIIWRKLSWQKLSAQVILSQK